MISRAALLWRNIRHWEFWPFWLFYTPVYVQILWRGLVTRDIGRFACANPGLPYGGLLEYSKWSLLRQLPARYVPRTVVLPLGCDLAEAERALSRAGMSYPVFAKPDRGERGLMVEKVVGPSELEDYLWNCREFLRRYERAGGLASEEKLLLQEVAPGEVEFGVLFVRFPGESEGQISSIVRKDLPFVVGDGARTLRELILRGERTRLHRAQLQDEFSERLEEIPEVGVRVQLVQVGNHIRGATFLDANHLINRQLEALFGRLASDLEGFNLGRFDLRCDSPAALGAGDFQVIEINGVNSEPAHIYDPANRLFPAWRDLLRHWRVVHSLGAANVSAGCSAPSGRELLAAIGRHARRRRLVSG